MAGNMMKNYEQQILSLTEDERIELAKQCIATVISDEEGGLRFEVNAIIGIVLVGARIGIGANRPLKLGERKLSKSFAEWLLEDGSAETFANAVKSVELNVKVYDTVKSLSNFGWEVAMAYFHYILCWALADGVIEPELEKRLENMFGLFFILDFADSGLESVPVPRVQVTGSETEIVLELKNDEHLTFLRDIQARFPNRSGSEVKRALDSLCEKGVVSCVDTAVGMMYSLENADSIEITRSNSASASNGSGNSQKREPAKQDAKKNSAPARQAKKQDSEAEKQLKEEAAKKQREEEEQRRQAAVEKYEKEYAETQKKRADFIASETKRIEKEYREALASLHSKYEADCAANQQKSEAARAQQKYLEQELSKVGLFEFRKKAELKSAIEANRAKFNQLADEWVKLDSAYESAKKAKAAAREAALDKLPGTASKKYPLPKDPRTLRQQTAEQSMPQGKPSAQQRANKILKDAIIAQMESGRLYTVSDVLKEIPECNWFNPQKVSPLLSQMEKEGLLEKVSENQTTYYLKRMAQREPSAQQRANKILKDAIFAQMESGRLYTVWDVLMEIPECNGFNPQKVSPLLSQMEKEGLLEKVSENRKTYYHRMD